MCASFSFWLIRQSEGIQAAARDMVTLQENWTHHFALPGITVCSSESSMVWTKTEESKLHISAAKFTDWTNCKTKGKIKKQHKSGFFVSGVCHRIGVFLLLEEKCSHTADFTLLFHKDLKVLVNDGYGQEDSCTRSDGSQEVCHDRQPSYTEPSKSSGCGDVPAEKTERVPGNGFF